MQLALCDNNNCQDTFDLRFTASIRSNSSSPIETIFLSERLPLTIVFLGFSKDGGGPTI